MLKKYKRPVSEIAFFNRLWDIYERHIAESNTKWKDTAPLTTQSAIQNNMIRDEWRFLVDQIVSVTDQEMESFTFGDYLDPFLDDNSCQSVVCCFADEVIEDDSMMTVRSRAKGLEICETYPKDWSPHFHYAWDRYLLALVERRQDIWKHSGSHNRVKRIRDQTSEEGPINKRIKQ